MLTTEIQAFGDDVQESQSADTVDAGYSSESIYDRIVAEDYGGTVNNILLIFTEGIAVSEAVTSATLKLWVQRVPSNTQSYSVYFDEGANRQDAFDTNSRYETGFTATTAAGSVDDTDMTVSEYVDIDVTSALNELIADANGGWNSGDTVRLAVVADSVVSGDTFRIAGFWHTADPDNDHAAILEVTPAAGGGSNTAIFLTTLGTG